MTGVWGSEEARHLGLVQEIAQPGGPVAREPKVRFRSSGTVSRGLTVGAALLIALFEN
jgi:hypothetical protein